MPLPANSISRANGAVIQTLTPMQFIEGQSVKIIIPPAMLATMTFAAYDYGMPEISNMLGNVVFTNAALPNFFRTDIDSRFFQPFIYQPNAPQFAQAVPVGEKNNQLYGAWRNELGPRSPFGGENLFDTD